MMDLRVLLTACNEAHMEKVHEFAAWLAENNEIYNKIKQMVAFDKYGKKCIIYTTRRHDKTIGRMAYVSKFKGKD